MSALLQRGCKGHRHGKGPWSICYIDYIYIVYLLYICYISWYICLSALNSLLQFAHEDWARNLANSVCPLPALLVRLQQLVALDEGQKTTGEGLSIPVYITPRMALLPSASRSILDAGGSHSQPPLTVPEHGSQDSQPSSEVPHLPRSALSRHLSPAPNYCGSSSCQTVSPPQKSVTYVGPHPNFQILETPTALFSQA